MKNKIKWLRVLVVITFPLWIIPLMILGILSIIILSIIEAIQDLYGWCVESEPKPKPLDYNEPHDYPDDDEYPSW